MATSYTPTTVLGVIVAVGAATFLIRVSFVALFGYLDEVPATVERALRFVPAAVLAALVVPSLVAADPGAGSLVGAVDGRRLVAGTFAAVVAWRTESVLATMVAGMGTLWAATVLF